MLEMRAFDEKVGELFESGQLPGFVHLYLGQEAVGTGALAALETDDYILSTHRGHGHAIAKGLDPRRPPTLERLMIDPSVPDSTIRSAAICEPKNTPLTLMSMSRW